MSSSLARRTSLPQLSPRWTATDAAAAQSDRNAGQRAAREGTDGAGALDRFWRRLAAEAAGDLLRLYGECGRMMADHQARRERLRHEHDSDLVNLAAANQRQHDERLAALKRECGPEAGTYKERSAKAEDAQKALRAVRGDVNSRPLRTQFGAFYGVMMALLALAEVPVNRAAFELTFREEPVFSLLLAAAVGIILIFFAHVIGLILRRWPRRLSVGQAAARVGTIAGILGGVGAAVYFMAKMRQGFIRLTTAENDGFAQRLQDALRGGTPGAVSVMVDVPLAANDWTFVALNILIFLFGVVASFLRHDPHPDYERAIRDARRTERAFAKVERTYGAAMRDEAARYEARKQSLEGQMGELRATLAALADQLGGIDEHCAASRRMVAHALVRRCASFADGYGAVPGGGGLAVPPLDTILDGLPAATEGAYAR